jgi:hypothetical protein
MINDKITATVNNTCKIGQGAACCKYLVMGANGFECMKVDPVSKLIIDTNWAKHPHTAQGDNCAGETDYSKLNKVN